MQQQTTQQQKQAIQSRRHLATALNNTGTLLHASGDHIGALSLFQESVNTRMKALRFDKAPAPSSSGEASASSSNRATLAEEVANSRAVEARYCAVRTEEAHLRSSLGFGTAADPPLGDLEQNDLDLYQLKNELHSPSAWTEHKSSSPPKRFSSPLRICSHPAALLGPTLESEASNAVASAITLYNIGLANHRLGEKDSALRLFKMCLTVLPAETSPEIAAVALNNVAQIHYQSGDVNGAMDCLKEALHYEQRSSLPVPSSAATVNSGLTSQVDLEGCIAATLTLMGRIQHDKGSHQEALDLLQEVLRLQRGSLGDDHIDVAVTLYNIGVVMHSLPGGLDEAVSHCKWFLQKAMSALPEADSNPQIAEALLVMGCMLLENAQVTESYKILKLAITVGRKAAEGNNKVLLRSLVTLAHLCHDSGQFDEASSHYREWIQINSSVLGRDHEEVAAIRCSLGQVQVSLGELDEALVSFEEVLRIGRLSYGDRDIVVASVLEMIGNVHLEKGETDDALANFSDAKWIREQVSREASQSSSSPRLGQGILARHVTRSLTINFHPAAAAA